MIGAYLGGFISDRFGRKVIFLGGISITTGIWVYFIES
jgi:MFS family permease